MPSITVNVRLLDAALLEVTAEQYGNAIENGTMSPAEARADFHALVRGMLVLEIAR